MVRMLTKEHVDALDTLADLRKRRRITHADSLILRKAVEAQHYQEMKSSGPSMAPPPGG